MWPRIAQVGFLPAPSGLAARELIARWSSLADIAELTARAGTDVVVLQAARHDEYWQQAGVDYHLVDVGRLSPYARGRRMADVLRNMQVDAVHVHGLGFPVEVAAMARALPRLPILLQDHADRPPRRWLRRQLWRRSYRTVRAVSFTAGGLAEPFLRAHVFDQHARHWAIAESSSRFTPGDRAQARAITGVHGEPAILWVGHLAPGKDPLTALEGVALAAERLPMLHLWCVYGQAPMEGEVRDAVARDPRLFGRVHLLGHVPHGRVEQLLRAANLYLSASRREGCGYAAMEAIACGVSPVLSDIPAFRALTGEGTVGHLWPCGNPAALAEALIAGALAPTPAVALREHFQANLSFEALGRLWREAYIALLAGEIGNSGHAP